MKIVSWNCHYGFDGAKKEAIMQEYHDIDILIVQECTKSDHDAMKSDWSCRNWYADDEKEPDGGGDGVLGIAIYSNKYQIDFTEKFNRKFRYVVPYHITDTENKKSFILFVVWAKNYIINKNVESFAYDKNVIEAIKHYHIEKQSIVIGDYNTFAHNADTKYPPLVNCARNTEAGKNTFYSQKDGFGIDDFCFATPDIAGKIDAKICQDSETEWEEQSKLWHGLSDHCPIIVEFDL